MAKRSPSRCLVVTEPFYAAAVVGGAHRWAPTAWVLVGAACAAPSDELAREQWLRHTLVLDNQVFLDRDPVQSGGKLAKMGDALYDFFRGTAPQYARDAMQPGSPGYWPSAYETAETSDVALVGDPHPENIGTYARAADSPVIVELNDFDAATFGPYGFDLRRLALGYWIAVEQVRRELAEASVTDPERTLDEAQRLAAAQAVVRGYAAEIAVVAEDPRQARPMTVDDEVGVVLTTLTSDALDDGSTRKELEDYTREEHGRRVMLHGDVELQRVLAYGPFSQLVYADTVEPVDAREQALVEALLERWADSLVDDTALDPSTWRLAGVSRRLGAGVASYPALRFYALLEGPGEGPEGDVMLELKQVLDAAQMPGLPRFPAQPFYTNAERVVQMQRRLQSTPEADPWLGWASLGNDGYRVRWLTGYQRNLRIDHLVEGLAEGAYTADDVVALAEASGRLLARRHGSANKLDGQPGAPAIASAIDGDDEGLVEEVTSFVQRYAPQVVADHETFVELLEEHGTALGYVPR